MNDGRPLPWEVRVGDCRALLADVPDGSVDCVVTSPPYWGLRDYGVDGQLGLETTHLDYVASMVGVFGEVRRVLRKDGTLWLNLGDSYAREPASNVPQTKNPGCEYPDHAKRGRSDGRCSGGDRPGHRARTAGLKPKDLVGIPWRVAFALQDDGWYLRSDIVWAKPNPMPESVTDRPTKAHEYVFLLSKGERYRYDAAAVAESAESFGRKAGVNSHANVDRDPAHGTRKQDAVAKRQCAGFNARWDATEAAGGAKDVRNRRTVWTIATEPFPGAHFATMPTALVEPCILAGCPLGGLVLDPFAGAGTVGLVATRLRRRFLGLELNPTYAEMARRRIAEDAPLFNRVGAA